jgi:hypothetical protein
MSPRAVLPRAPHPPPDQAEFRVLPAGPDIARRHRDILVHLSGNSPAARACRGDSNPGPGREPPAGPALRFRYFHTVHPKQRRRRILGRRGPVILDRHKSGYSGPLPPCSGHCAFSRTITQRKEVAYRARPSSKTQKSLFQGNLKRREVIQEPGSTVLYE